MKSPMARSNSGTIHCKSRCYSKSLARAIPQRSVQKSIGTNQGFLWFSFTSLCDWSRKPVPLSQLIRFKSKTLIARVFARFRQFACFDLEFSLVPCDIFPCFDWLLRMLWFGFMTCAQSKSGWFCLNIR